MAIVADNCDGFNMRYYRLPDTFKDGVDQASTSTDSIVWAVGDVVEVLDGGYWKVSVIEDDLGEDFYQICVIGALDEFIVNKSNIRKQQEWRDDMWVSSGTDSENCEDGAKSLKRPLSDMSYTDEDYSEYTQKQGSLNKKLKLDAIHDDPCSFDRNGSSGVNFEENQSIHDDDTMFLARASDSTDCDSLRHGSLIAAFIMMMSWLSTSSVVSLEKDIIYSRFFAVKAISV